MGTFANSAISLLLGWVKGTAQWIWSIFESPEGNAVVAWLGSHWVLTAVLLCLLGVVLDFVVYLFRWRPDLVWRTFFRKLRGRYGVRTPEQDADARTGELPDDMEGTAYPRKRRADRHRARRAVSELFRDDDGDVKTYRPHRPAGDEQAAFNEPYYPPQWNGQDDQSGSTQA